MVGDCIDARFFQKYYFLISHKFEGEASNEGWIGLDVKLDTPLDNDYTLGMSYYLSIKFQNIFSCFCDSKQCCHDRQVPQNTKGLHVGGVSCFCIDCVVFNYSIILHKDVKEKAAGEI